MPQLSRTRFLPIALAALALALSAVLFTALSPGSAVQNAEAAGVVTINIKDYKYSKTTVTIKKGQSIKWVNKDSMKHNAYSSKAGGPKGPLLAKNKSWTWKATKAGTFNYICSPHPFMKAKVIVK